MKRILFLVQLPPPVHGVAIINDVVVNSKVIAEHFESRSVNIGAAGNIEDIGKFSLSKLTGVARTLAAIIRQLFVFRPDIVYLSLSPTGFAFYRDVIYVYIVRLFSPELVLHLHGQGFRKGSEKSRLFRWLCKSIFRNSHVIFLSERLRADAAGLTYKSSYTVNNGYVDGPVPARRSNDEGAAVGILYLSNYVRTKGILDLMDALEVVARTHNRFFVNMAGRPADFSLEFLENYAREKGLADKVRISGAKYNEEKLDLLKTADIFVLPTYYEAFPLAILEAMKFGLTVVSTYEGGIPDIIEPGVDGLLYPQRDTAALARDIIYLLDHPEARTSLGEAARKKFLERFTISIFEQNMLRVFRQICSRDETEL